MKQKISEHLFFLIAPAILWVLDHFLALLYWVPVKVYREESKAAMDLWRQRRQSSK